MTQYVYTMKGMSKNVNGKQILKETWLSFIPGAKIGIIGHNGAGKSTLLRIMAGIDKEFSGEAFAQDGIKIGYLAQEPKLDENRTAYENIQDALKEKKDLLDEYNEISAKFAEEMSPDEMNDLIERQGFLQEKIDALEAWDIDREIQIAMDALRCPPKEAVVSSLSGGEKRRVAICKLLLEKPDMLLLDEPTNHLDAESVSWLENYLKKYRGCVVVITHDRYFLDNVTEWILEIDRGHCVPWNSNYSEWLRQKQEKLENEDKEDEQRKKMLAKELEWVRQSPKARQAKNKARMTAYEELLASEKDRSNYTGQIVIPNGPRLGDVVVEANDLKKSFDGRILFENFSFKIPKGAIVGIIGPNGAGKSTLFKLIAGLETPDSGSIHLGSTVKLGYVNQTRDHLDDNKNIWEEVSEGQEEIELGKMKVKSRAYCASFNFKGADQQKKVGMLSGGERNRVHMAKLLKSGANVLMLDEPSNDLDVDTLRALEDAIMDFAGCVFVISHDRWFLDRIATHIISIDGSGEGVFFEGNFESYSKYMQDTFGEDYFSKKYKHKKLA
jgi:sulfate-transporting ATPase